MAAGYGRLRDGSRPNKTHSATFVLAGAER